MIHLLAEIKAFPDSAQQVQALLEALLEPSRNEEGCCQYELYRDNSIEGLFFNAGNLVLGRELAKAPTERPFPAFSAKDR